MAYIVGDRGSRLPPVVTPTLRMGNRNQVVKASSFASPPAQLLSQFDLQSIRASGIRLALVDIELGPGSSPVTLSLNPLSDSFPQAILEFSHRPNDLILDLRSWDSLQRS